MGRGCRDEPDALFWSRHTSARRRRASFCAFFRRKAPRYVSFSSSTLDVWKANTSTMVHCTYCKREVDVEVDVANGFTYVTRHKRTR